MVESVKVVTRPNDCTSYSEESQESRHTCTRTRPKPSHNFRLQSFRSLHRVQPRATRFISLRVVCGVSRSRENCPLTLRKSCCIAHLRRCWSLHRPPPPSQSPRCSSCCSENSTWRRRTLGSGVDETMDGKYVRYLPAGNRRLLCSGNVVGASTNN